MTRIAAFFDVDATILDRSTTPSWVRFLHRKGRAGPGDVARALWWLAQYRLAIVDIGRMVGEVARALGGRSEREMEGWMREWFRTEVIHFLRPVAAVVIDRHRALGDEIVLLTGGLPYLARELADHLGIQHVISSRLAVVDGMFTGEAVEPVCFGFGKVMHAEEFARERAIDLERSSFYTDSYTDLPMLLRVGNPRPVDPDVRLRLYARKAGWPVEQW